MPAVDPELADLLSEAAVEIANLDSPQNVVAKRLRAAIRAADEEEPATEERQERA